MVVTTMEMPRVLKAAILWLLVWLCRCNGAERPRKENEVASLLTNLCGSIPQNTISEPRSGVCASKPQDCHHQLKDPKNSNGTCLLEYISPEDYPDCQMGTQSKLSPGKDTMFNLRMYYYETWMGRRPVLNLTFKEQNWNKMKFRYENYKGGILCRDFSLSNVNIPLTETLMWDCPMFSDKDYIEHDFELRLLSDRGEGGRYSFKIPEQDRFNPLGSNCTRLKDWHVFFFVHLDHLNKSSYLPVTLQFAPFENLAYNISLEKCLDDDHLCTRREGVVARSVSETNMAVDRDGLPGQWTELLPFWDIPGLYTISVRIVSDHCGDDGCFISLSPVFEIERGKWVIWLSIALVLLLVFACVFTGTLRYHLWHSKKVLERQKSAMPTTLLVYLPENSACLELVKTFGKFLKDVCYIHPYIIDEDAGNQNPSSWTSELLNVADTVLFLIPGNPNGESVSPIKDHWTNALEYVTRHHYATHNVQSRVATVLLPFSAKVPFQVANVRRFRMVPDVVSLVNWIHQGTWLNRLFLWRPLIRASHPDLCTLSDVEDGVFKAEQVTECYGDVTFTAKPKENGVSSQNVASNINPKCSVDHEEKNGIIQKEPGLVPEDPQSIPELTNVYDSDIPDANNLPLMGKEATQDTRIDVGSSDESSGDSSSDELDEKYF